jgi:hypothetical protein
MRRPVVMLDLPSHFEVAMNPSDGSKTPRHFVQV